MNILDEIVKKTKERTALLNEKVLMEGAFRLPAGNFTFKNALSGINNYSNGVKIIAEIKKASPSRGLICKDFDPVKIAGEYKKAHVDCISVLTEPYYFLGENSYVADAKTAADKPVLRKDFIIEPSQIYEAKLIGADCILLICTILDETKIKKFLKITRSLGICALVETHNEDEIKIALKSGAEIIGVNNRNLKSFEVDFSNSLNLRKFVPKDKIFISESGIKTREDILKLEEAGVNAVLIGETFMRALDKTLEIKKLKGLL